ncbi:PREDICTED: huntingtin-like [Branchiostoma belcheri]|uniref:Huntingtin-like n=1 Tax=Branchiostoma belcheri TaxID=7741 RepID=A0A6P4ZX14_BRABE|nr:PREDICTED: huntingtin-like [Branchiostoma belcheri]
MATTEKLLKAFESLKAFQQGTVTGEETASSSQTAPVGQMSNLLTTSPAEFTEVARDIVASLATGKKELAVGKKDRVAHLVTIADAMCASNFRTMAEFPKFLGISMEMFLASCDDKESDVRMVADECLNRTVKMLLETNLGRLQVELYKEIKKNGAARSLRAALWRFAELSHLIRPQKCRPYVVNLLPCFNRICRRQEDAVQETLANSLKKTFPVLGSFTNDAEIKVLLKTFLPNLRSTSAVTRRTAASSLVVFCQYSRKPRHFFCWLLTVLLGMVIPIQEDRKSHTLLGVLLCLRHLVPHLATLHDLEDDSLKGSFGVTKKDPELSVNTEQLVQIFELVLHYSQHTDHNVVTASLETFQQLLRTPPPGLLPVLTRPGTITQSSIFKEAGQQRVGSASQLSGVGEEDSGMEDDRSEVSSTATDDLPPIVKLNLDPSTMQPMTLEQSASAADLETLDSSAAESSGIGLLQTGGEGGIFNALEKVERLPDTATEFSGLKYDLWIQAICEEQGTPALQLESLVSRLQACLTDQASVTCRMACVALKTCLVTLLQSSSGDLGLRLVLATLGQRDTSYWLGKVELLELLSLVDFKLVKYLEDSFPFMRKGEHSYLGAMNCQQRLLEDIVLHLMGDDDYRVRHAATSALVRLVPRLFYPVDHPQHDPVVASAKVYSSAHLDQEGQQLGEEPYRPPPCTMWGYETSGLVSASLESSLSRVISAIMRRLNSSTSKSLTFGCLHALCQLSVEFPVCQYTTAWCCVGITTFTPKDSSGRANLPRPGSRSRSLNGSLTSSMTSSLTSSITSTSSISSVSSQLSMEESITGSGGGPLPMVLSLLLSSWLPLDLAAHQDALLLAGNLLAGAASRSLKAPYEEEKPSGKDGAKEGGKEEEEGWHALQDRNLVPLAQQLLSHLARVVNVCSHVIEQVTPGPPAKTALPSLPNAPSLSPIKRKPKGKDGVDQGSATASPSKSSAKKGSDAACILVVEARLKYDLWIQAICEEQGTPALQLESLVSCLQSCLTDQASVTCRMACVALKTCLVTLLQSSSGDLGLRLVLATLGQRDTSYWLGKVELLELLSLVDFKLVKYLEDSFPFMRKGEHSYLGAMNCQQRLLEDIVLHLMGDDDYRVRHAATSALVRLVPRLFYPVDHPQHDPVVASAKVYSSAHLDQEGQQLGEEPYRPPPCTMWGYETSGLVSASLESSLSRVISAIMRRLNSSTSKSLTFGCLHALCQLSVEFPVCQYTTAWCCVGITTFTPKDSSGRANLPRPGSRSRSLNGSLTSSMTSSLTSSITSTSSISSVSSQLSMEESITGSGGGPLPMVLSLLLSSWLPLDLAAHQDALLLAGNLLAGAASRSLKAPYEEEKPSGKDGAKEGGKEEEEGWHALQDRNLVPLAQQLLSHLARVVNVCSHVIEQVTPGPPAKTALPSLPNAPSLSPIKRKPKGKDGVDQGSATASPSKSSAKKGSDAGLPTEKEPDRPNKSNIGTFWQLPGYMKLYSVLKGAYSNYKVSLDPSATEKFTGLLKTVLNVLSQVLEIATFIDISKYVEELLSYLKSTVAMEPTSTIQCVEQLLKALFGTNLASQWDGSQTAETSRKPGKATRLSSNMKPGLYHYCFTAPYTQFTQSLAAASFRTSQAEGEEGGGILSWFKHRSSDKKVSPAIAKLVKGDKTPIHNYIRLFEPLVIKSLKLYTVTSSVTLQRQVLHLLAQLVQLRVNYCLLDSDQIFIGFVIKQFEYIEAGQIRGSETLIPPIFHFLVLLSYERYHSKSIIVMPRIIQLCDGVMASGQKATNHAIPALQPIVHDLFVLRGNSKADQGKELDTQREVVVSMLVRLIHYPEVLEMLTIVLQQCHKESEDRWKKLSRQVVDMVLPMLARQQICLSTPSALNTLHGLFESVTPSSLRPLDMLLKTLFSPPTDLTSPDSFLRWSCMVLSILRVLISQSKEEVIMARLQELGLSANIFTNNVIYRAKGRAVDLDGDAPFEEVPEEALARFLLQVIGALAEEIAFRSNTSALQREGCHSLAQQLAHLLLYVTYILKSGLFRKVLSAAMALPEESPTEAYYSVEQLNLFFQDMVPSHPTLVLQWCQILLLLNFNELSWWSEIMQTPKRSLKASSSSSNSGGGGGKKGKARTPDEVANKSAICCSEEVVRRGGLILFCDYVTPVFTPLIPATATLYGELVLEKKCQNLSDVEHMTWVIINHVKDLIELAQEPPVQDFISAIHRNSAASGLFLQAIHSRCEKLSKPCIVKSMLGCLEGIHLTQSGTLLTLLIDKFLQTPHHALARMCDSLACRRVEMILAQPVEDSRTQFPVEDVEKLQVFMRESGLALRHQRLASLLARFKAVITHQAVPPVEPPPSSHPLDAANINIASLSINKDLYVATVQDHCFRRDSNAQECALMLSKLDYSDILTIMMTKEFHMRLLEDSISVGLHQSLASSSKADKLNRTKGLKLGKAHSLLRASCITLLRHVSNIVNILPSPQQLVSPGNHHPGNHTSRSRTPPREKYRLKMDMLFADREWRHSVFHMAAGLTVYLLSLNKIPEQCQVPEDSFTDICRFSVLVLEILCYLLYKGRTPSSQQLQTAVECCCAVLKNLQLFAIITATEHANLVTTAVGSIHQVVKSVCISAGEKLSPVNLPEPGEDKNVSEDQQRALLACRQMCELLQCLTTTLSPANTRLPQFLAAPLRNVVLNLARLPLVNSYARTPPIVWKMGWGAMPGGETGTKLPELPFDFLQEREVLKDFIFRINAVGWTSRTQFEETWAGLLGILSALPITVPAESREEEIEKTQANVLAVRTITALVLDSTLHPQPGNPASSVYEYRPRSKPPSYINTRSGRKLAQVRHIVEKEIMAIAAERCDLCSHHPYFNMHEHQLLEGEGGLYSGDVHRTLGFTDYGLGHVSIKSIWSDNHILNQTPDTDEEPEFPEQEDGTSQPLVTTPRRFRGGLDIHSCLQFLVELYSQWMEPTAMPRTPVPLLCEVAKSILLISDLFTELRQYEWMFDSLLELNKIHPVEDEILLQYVVPGVCKAGAVMGMEGPVAERVSKLLESSLKSTHLPTKVGSVYGSLYILEAGPSEATKLLVPVLQDYLGKNIPPTAQCCIVHVEPHVLAMWATVFYLLEHYQDDLKESDFKSTMLQAAITTASGSEEVTPAPVYHAVVRGLERLLVTRVLTGHEAEPLVKLSVDRLCLPSPPRAIAALGLMLTCMYTGKDGGDLSSDTGSEPTTPDNESLIVAMERVTVLFDRIRKGFPCEARVVARILPTFLDDFFPAQDIMNKVIGEFLSSQQPHPQLMAKVLYDVFHNLHERDQQQVVRDWVMLSLSNFTQRTPVAMATWSLTCFFLSASTNPWVCALLPHVIGRMGLMETVDRKLFCITALDFYKNQITEELDRRAFESIFQAASSSAPDGPYLQLIQLIH